MKIEISERETVCANCQHFYQHYIKNDGVYKACNAGHCCYPRLKNRRPGDVCEKWVQKSPQQCWRTN